jgi:hypothetical protein
MDISARRICEWTLLAASAALLLLRFTRLDLAPFVNDEPAFLLAARQQWLTGEPAVISPLRGMVGVSYGPSVIWWYGLVQGLTGSHSAVTAIGSMCLLLTLAQAASALAAGTFFAPRRPVLACAMALSVYATAPFQTFWSRLAWDQLTNAIPCIVVAILCRKRVGLVAAGAVGALLGLGLSSHPMVAGFALCVGLTFVWEHWRNWRRLASMLAVIAGPALLVNVPYLTALWAQHPKSTVVWNQPSWEPARFIETYRPSSLWHIDYFFDRDWGQFLGFTGLGRASGTLGMVTVMLAAALSWWGLGCGYLVFRDFRRRVVVLAALTVIVHPLYLGAIGAAPQPHYQFPTAWIVPVTVAMLVACRPPRSFLSGAAHAAVLSLSCMLFVFNALWFAFIDVRSGTRGVHYSSPVGEQLKVIEQLCSLPSPAIEIENTTTVFSHALAYHARIDPRCADKSILFCRPGRCPGQVGSVAHLLLEYERERGGSLTLH